MKGLVKASFKDTPNWLIVKDLHTLINKHRNYQLSGSIERKSGCVFLQTKMVIVQIWFAMDIPRRMNKRARRIPTPLNQSFSPISKIWERTHS
jgi:hypothetical protein